MYGVAPSSTFGATYSASLNRLLLTQPLLEVGFAFLLVVALALPLIARISKLLEDASAKGTRRVESLAAEQAKHDVLRPRHSTLTIDRYPSTILVSDGSSKCSLRLEMAACSRDKPSELERDEWHVDYESPLVDSASYDYRAYRHKLMDEVFKKYYAQQQPPGRVVMNSIHLNSKTHLDPQLDRTTRDRHLDLFGFVDCGYEMPELSPYGDTQYLHPLDHFLVKGTTKLPTTDKCIETKNPSLWSILDGSDVLQPSGRKNEGNVRTSTNTSQSFSARRNPETLSRCVVGEERARGQADKSKMLASSSVPGASCRMDPSNPRRAPDVLGIEREDSLRPLTANESSSDVCSLLYAESNCQGARQRSTRRKQHDKDPAKRPWLISSQPDSFNRKYAKHAREATETHGTVGSRAHSPNGARRQQPLTVHNSATSLASTRQSPCPSKHEIYHQHTAKRNEVLERVTLLCSSSAIQQRNSEEDKSSQRPRGRNDHSDLAEELALRDEAGSKQERRHREARSDPPDLRSDSFTRTTRGKASRLPLHVNSKKPMGVGKTPEVTEHEINLAGKRRDSISSTESFVVAPSQLQRPKTSCGVINRNSVARKHGSRESDDYGAVDDVVKAAKENRTKARPRTSDSTELSKLSGVLCPAKKSNDETVAHKPSLSSKLFVRCRRNSHDRLSKKPLLTNSVIANSESSTRLRFVDSKAPIDRLSLLKNDEANTTGQAEAPAPLEKQRQSNPVTRISGGGGQDSPKVEMVTNRGLKNYIAKLRQVLTQQQHDQLGAEKVRVAGLSLSEVITADVRANLSSVEINELHDILQAAECKIDSGDLAKH